MSMALAHRPVDQSEWGIMREQATVLVKTGFLPEAIRTPEQAVAIMLKGRELNLPPMYALSNIVVIKGKPVANAELMLALIYRDHGDNAIRFTRSDAQACTVEYRRRSWQRPEQFSFTIEDADRAGLLTPKTDRNGNPTAWQKFTPAMLRARCISAVARMAFADTIGGLYTPEELGAPVLVTDEGELQTGEVVEASYTVEQPARPQLVEQPDLVDIEARFWAKFEAPLGGREWSRVIDLVGPAPEPTTAEDWYEIGRRVNTALKQEAQAAA